MTKRSSTDGLSRSDGSQWEPRTLHDNVIHLAGRIPLPPSRSVARSRGKKGRALFHPVIFSLVGQREGRLTEMLPPEGNRAAKAESFVPGQGNSLSHSFMARLLRDVAIAPKEAAFIVVSGIGIPSAVIALLCIAS